MKVFSAGQMRDFDRAAIEKYQVPSIVLMENAALRVVEFLESKFAPLHGKRVAIFCGKGNNGGDGFAIARHLIGCGCEVTVLLATTPDDLRGDAGVNFAALQRALGAESIITLTGKKSALSPVQREALRFSEIVLDALLGTGFHGAVRDAVMLQALELMRCASGIHIAIDLPSALNADTGEAAPEIAKADCTVTFAAPKRGFFLRDGVDTCGELWVGGIGAPLAQVESTETGCELLTPTAIRGLLPHRAPDAHKGDAGRVIIIGGSTGMSGAPCLASRAALSIGAGLCITCLPEKVQPVFAASVLEATSHSLPCDENGGFLSSAADALPKIWDGAQVVALGPGLSRSEEALNFARRIMRECPLPLVIDADALYALRAIEAEVKARKAPTILTPHPGEMGELMQIPTKDVQNDRLGIAAACAQKYSAVIVLKGARSVIATPEGGLYINPTGNSGMATGGSGDVLTGTISGLLAQTRDAETATLLGVYLHGLAGNIAFRERSNGLIAGDIAAHLPHALLEAETTETQHINARLQRVF